MNAEETKFTHILLRCTLLNSLLSTLLSYSSIKEQKLSLTSEERLHKKKKGFTPKCKGGQKCKMEIPIPTLLFRAFQMKTRSELENTKSILLEVDFLGFQKKNLNFFWKLTSNMWKM